MPQTLKIEQQVRLEGGNWTYFKVGHAPDGGRTIEHGPIHEKPFAFIFACAAVMAAEPQYGSAHQYREAVVVHVGDEVDIEGYGLHRIEFAGSEKFPDRYNLRVVRLVDGFRS